MALLKMHVISDVFLVCTLLALQSCAPSFPVNQDLKAELAQRSRSEGLAIITTWPSSGTLPVAYFDHRWEKLNCCGRTSDTWVTTGGRQLISVEHSIPSTAELKSGNPGVLLSYVKPNVVLFDLKGVERRRLTIRISAAFLAVSADGKMMAFTGEREPLPPTISDSIQNADGSTSRVRGLLFGSLGSASFSKIYSLPEERFAATTGERPQTIAWSPDDNEIVYGKDGKIFIYNLQKHSSRELARGSNPLWSPDGLWISYRGQQGEAMLIAPSAQRQQQILPGRKIQHALHWSPDGRYLLLTFLSESVPWASLAVCRLSDGAITSIGEPGLTTLGLDDAGSDWVLMGPQH